MMKVDKWTIKYIEKLRDQYQESLNKNHDKYDLGVIDGINLILSVLRGEK